VIVKLAMLQPIAHLGEFPKISMHLAKLLYVMLEDTVILKLLLINPNALQPHAVRILIALHGQLKTTLQINVSLLIAIKEHVNLNKLMILPNAFQLHARIVNHQAHVKPQIVSALQQDTSVLVNKRIVMMVSIAPLILVMQPLETVFIPLVLLIHAPVALMILIAQHGVFLNNSIIAKYQDAMFKRSVLLLQLQIYPVFHNSSVINNAQLKINAINQFVIIMLRKMLFVIPNHQFLVMITMYAQPILAFLKRDVLIPSHLLLNAKNVLKTLIAQLMLSITI
jgi:hypothetical protein